MWRLTLLISLLPPSAAFSRALLPPLPTSPTPHHPHAALTPSATPLPSQLAACRARVSLGPYASKPSLSRWIPCARTAPSHISSLIARCKLFLSPRLARTLNSLRLALLSLLIPLALTAPSLGSSIDPDFAASPAVEISCHSSSHALRGAGSDESAQLASICSMSQRQAPPLREESLCEPVSPAGSNQHSHPRAAPPFATVGTAPSVGDLLVRGVNTLQRSAEELQDHLSFVERDTMLLLLASALVTPLMSTLGLSPVLGFLFAGIIMGPAGLALVSDVRATSKLAEFGVVFFLFEMGLELELERLKSVGRDAFRLGSTQFLLTSVVMATLARILGASAASALVLGGALALSSSAFVIQLLSEKGELASRFGRASFGILLFQDLAVVPLLVVTPLLGGTGAQLSVALRSAAIKSVSALTIIFLVGRLLLQRVFQLVASARDQTSFLAITLLTVLSMSAFTQALGLSDTLGAFLAGILLAESKYRFQIEADIAPFRGLLLGLFFITTGFSIDIIVALRSAPLVLGLAVSLHLVKTAITAAICMVVGKMKPAASLRSGLLLSQGGEFAFVIFALAQEHNILLPNEVKLLLTVVVLTMFLTPFLNELGSAISTNQAQKSGGLLLPTTEGAENGDYVLVCGFGRVGQSVCELLTSKLVRYKAFDLDPYRVTEARSLGLPVFYGDARRPDVLQAFMKESENKMSAVVIALDLEKDVTRAVRALRRQFPTVKEMPIFVRATDEKHRRKLASAGAIALDTGPQESALLLGGALLSRLGFPQDEVARLIEDTRSSLYKKKMKTLMGDLEPGPLTKPFSKSSNAESKEEAVDLNAQLEKAIDVDANPSSTTSEEQ